MPQIMIDTATDSIESLRRFAKLMQDEADFREEETTRILEDAAKVPAGTLVGKGKEPAAPVVDVAPEVNTAAIFGGAPVSTLPPVVGYDPPAYTPPVLVPAAPSPVLPAAPVLQVGAELDSAGLPWDARIHQETRKQNKDKTWQNRRGIDKDMLAAVTTELKFNLQQQQQMQQSAPTATAPPPPPAAPQLAPPPPPAALAPPPPPVTPAAPGGVTGFRELMQKITAGTSGGKLTQEQVDAALASVGIPPRQLIALVTAPQHISAVSAYIDAYLMAAAA